MKILITGICGFAGSELAFELQERMANVQIIGLDNLSRRGSWRNISRLEAHGVRILHADVRQFSDLEYLGPFDWIIDAAANPSVLAGVGSQVSSRQLVEHNLLGTVQLLEACKRWQAGFVLLSSSRVYSISPLEKLPLIVTNEAFSLVSGSNVLPPGMSDRGISEVFQTQSPISIYGSSKLASEILALEYASAFDFPVFINRCGVLAGPGQFGKAEQGIYSYWLHSWFENKPLRYLGYEGMGYQVRDCLHPRDLGKLIAMQLSVGPSSDKPKVVNVSGGIKSACSLAQLSFWCQHRWGTRTVESDRVKRQFDLPYIILDNQLCRDSWSWEPEYSLEYILQEIASFVESNPNWLELYS